MVPLARVLLISHHFCTISGELYVHLCYSVLWPLWIRLELELEFADWHQNDKFGIELTFLFYNLVLFIKILIWSWPKAKWKVNWYFSGKEHCHSGEKGTLLKLTLLTAQMPNSSNLIIQQFLLSLTKTKTIPNFKLQLKTESRYFSFTYLPSLHTAF